MQRNVHDIPAGPWSLAVAKPYGLCGKPSAHKEVMTCTRKASGWMQKLCRIRCSTAACMYAKCGYLHANRQGGLSRFPLRSKVTRQYPSHPFLSHRDRASPTAGPSWSDAATTPPCAAACSAARRQCTCAGSHRRHCGSGGGRTEPLAADMRQYHASRKTFLYRQHDHHARDGRGNRNRMGNIAGAADPGMRMIGMELA